MLNNSSHDSVGGQPTVGLNTNFASIAKNCGYQLVLQAKTNNEIVKCMHDLKRFDGTVFFEVRVKKGFRKNLSRPTTTPIQNKKDLMEELTKTCRVLAKLDENAPHQKVVVLDGTVGQNAHSQLENFNEAIGLTGIIVTKLDGSAKGGVVVSLAEKGQQ